MTFACEGSLLFSSLPYRSGLLPWGEWAAAAGQMCWCVLFLCSSCLPRYLPGFSALQICMRSMVLVLQLCGQRECSNPPGD